MTAKWPIPRPTEHAALRSCAPAPRRLPPAPALLVAMVEAVGHRDRAAALEVGKS